MRHHFFISWLSGQNAISISIIFSFIQIDLISIYFKCFQGYQVQKYDKITIFVTTIENLCPLAPIFGGNT